MNNKQLKQLLKTTKLKAPKELIKLISSIPEEETKRVKGTK